AATAATASAEQRHEQEGDKATLDPHGSIRLRSFTDPIARRPEHAACPGPSSGAPSMPPVPATFRSRRAYADRERILDRLRTSGNGGGREPPGKGVMSLRRRARAEHRAAEAPVREMGRRSYWSGLRGKRLIAARPLRPGPAPLPRAKR